MSPFGPPWKLGVIGAVAVIAGIALLLVDWTIAQLAAFVAMLLIARGALHLTTTSFDGVTGALGTLQGAVEAGAGVLLLAWPHPTLLVLTVLVGAIVVVQATVDGTIVGATRREHRHRTARLGADVLQVVLGVALIARLSGTVHAAGLIIGIVAIVAGGVEIVTALSWRRAPRPFPAL
ncbi:MAG: hypothetical protein JWM72_431 [Actinomycetia bacterium]|jgi:uncharacterized membrane protein HdeD (DUF308 family)|nr:hypothetical protein [Actinomycetes bacterium]